MIMKHRLFRQALNAAGATAVLAVTTHAQVPVVGDDRPIAAGIDLPIVEPHLSVNPTSPRQLVAAAMVARADGTYGCISLASGDGGVTWRTHDFRLTDCGDVWTAFTADGTALLGLLTGDRSDFRVYRSRDGGASWDSTFTLIGPGHDHSMIVAQVSRPGHVYALSANSRRGATGRSRSAVAVARSSDAAVTFPQARQIVTSNLSYEAHSAALMDDGTLLVNFADHRRPGDRRRLERSRDWLLVSSDSGATFSEPLLIAESCDGSGGWSSIAVSSTRAPTPNRIYHACPTAGFAGIQVRSSDDKGETWSDAITLGAKLRVAPYARTPAIAINANGIVAVAWYDGRGDPSTIKGSLRCHEMFIALSRDGGATFPVETKVSSERSCPSGPRNIATALRFPSGGEYFGLAALPDGRFMLLWSDARSGIYQLRSAIVTP